MGQHLEQLRRIGTGLERQRSGLGGGEHLRGVDQVVAELDHLAHARAADVDDESRHRLERGRTESRVAASPPTMTVSVPRCGADGTARKRPVEISGAGGSDPPVLLALDIGVDRRGVDDDLARSERRKQSSTTLVTSGELGTHMKMTSDSRATPAGVPASVAPSCDCCVDRWPAPGGDGHVVAGRQEVAGHGEPHGPEPDESELHRVRPILGSR